MRGWKKTAKLIARYGNLKKLNPWQIKNMKNLFNSLTPEEQKKDILTMQRALNVKNDR